MKKTLYILILLVISYSLSAQENECLLDKKPVQDLVQDYANILDEATETYLRQTLIAFSDTTSTQILIVTVTDLCGYDKAEFTYTLGEKWKVGQQGKNNGVVIMIKPKEIDGRGETFIAPGYGLEGVLPDAIAKRIVEVEMIPYFKQKDYVSGIMAAANTVMSITSGEFTADDYKKKNSTGKGLPFIFLFVLGIIIFINVTKAKKYSSTNNLGFWAALMLMSSSGRRHGGSFGNFSSGGGSFGGFGGGSFGGGGAGGSW